MRFLPSFLAVACLAQSALFAQEMRDDSKPLELFQDVALPRRVTRDPARVDWRNVRLETSLLTGRPGAPDSAARYLTLPLFDGLTLTLAHRATLGAYGGGSVVVFDVEEDPFGSAIFAVTEDAVCASIRIGTSLYKLSPVGGGEHTFYRVDESKEPTCGGVLTAARAGGGGGGMPPAPPNDSSGYSIDVLVVYTPEAAAASGGESGMISMINLAQYETNLGYSQSDVVCRMQVVHIEELAYTESGDEYDYLYDLQDPNDGEIDEVHTLRDEHTADCVVMIYDAGVNAGLAYEQMCSLDPAYEASAFCVVQDTSATGFYTFAHEIGHLMGADHAVSDPNNVCQITPSSFGHKTTSYRTIMAYAPGTRLNFYSNPDKFDPGGEALGIAGAAENWATLNLTANTVASFRDAKDVGHELSTLFNADADCLGNMFDITPATDLEITGIDINCTNLFTTAVVDVWYRVGGYAGHEDTKEDWLLLASGNGISLGQDLPTHIDLAPSTFMHGGEKYGIFVHLTSSPTNSMRDSAGTPTDYRNRELSLLTGVGKDGGFLSPTNPDRVWNGELEYEPADGTKKLKTTYHGGAQNAGIMFNVDVSHNITVNSLDVNIDDSASPGHVAVDVWYQVGPYVGTDEDPFAWIYLGSDDKAVGAGKGQPTRIAIGDLSLNAGWDYAFYVHVNSYHLGHRLTFTPGSTSFSNEDLTIHAGVGKGEQVFGSYRSSGDREFNGALRYTPSAFEDLGYGLGGPTGLPVLTGSGPLLPDTGVKLVLSSAPPNNVAFFIIGLSTWYAPFEGGTMVPAFDYYIPLATDGRGTSVVAGTWPRDLPQGFPIYFQYWIPARGYWVASNALLATGQ